MQEECRRIGLKPPCQQWRVLRQATQICCRFQAYFSRWAVQWILYNCPISILPFLPIFPCDRLRDVLRSTLVPFYSSGSIPISFIFTHQELDSRTAVDSGYLLPVSVPNSGSALAQVSTSYLLPVPLHYLTTSASSFDKQ